MEDALILRGRCRFGRLGRLSRKCAVDAGALAVCAIAVLGRRRARSRLAGEGTSGERTCGLGTCGLRVRVLGPAKGSVYMGLGCSVVPGKGIAGLAIGGALRLLLVLRGPILGLISRHGCSLI